MSGLLIETLGEFLGQIGDHCRTRDPAGLHSLDEQVVEVVSELLAKWIQDHGGIITDSSALIVDVASWAMTAVQQAKPRESIKALRAVPTISALIVQHETTAAV